MPIIGIDARTFFDECSVARGIGHYAFHHVQALARLRADWEFMLFGLGEKPAASLQDLLRLSNVHYRNILGYRTELYDLLHIPDPMHCNPSPMLLLHHPVRTITFHDLTPFHHYLPLMKQPVREEYLARLDQLLKGNSFLLTNSEYTRQDLIKTIGFPPERSCAIMAGINRSDRSDALDPQNGRIWMEEMGIKTPFFLHVGALESYKNFQAVVSSFALCRKHTPIQLVVVGWLTALWEQRLERLAREMEDIVTTGFIPRAQLEILYRHATGLLLLSRSEGFGFPVLEAMANHCPVIASNATSLPEICGDAALLFAPDDIEGISRAMRSLLDDPEKAQEMRRKGALQASGFSWEKTAHKTLDIWEKMLGVDSHQRNRQQYPTRDIQTIGGSAPERASFSEPSCASPSPEVSIKWASHILEYHGLAAHSRLCLSALDRRNVRLAIEPFGLNKEFAASLRPEELQRWQRIMKQQVDGGVYICFAVPTTLLEGIDVFAFCRQRNPGFRKYIGIATFETDRLPSKWAKVCNGMDEIWVPSSFNREVFSHAGVKKPIHVFPTGMDTGVYDPAAVSAVNIRGRRGFAFLSVFQWTRRKGWDVLLKAYFSAFSPDDDVCLILRTYPYRRQKPAILERVHFYAGQLGYNPKRIPPVIVLDERIPEPLMPSLYKSADAFVLPTRGEGFGIPFMEAMAMGLPVIGTRWSGHLDFMNEANSYLIDIEGLMPVDPEQTAESPFYEPEHRWAEPAVDHTAFLMRHVYEHRQEATAKGRIARRDIQTLWHPDRTADWMIDRVGRLLGGESPKDTSTSPKSAGPEEELVEKQILFSSTSPPPFRIIWEGTQFFHHSMALVNREVCLQLVKRSDADLYIFASEPAQFGPEADPRFGRLSERMSAILSFPPNVHVRHHWPPDFTPPPYGHWVMIQPWEYGRLPKEWIEPMTNLVDEIWVPSHHALKTYLASGIPFDRVKVIPNGVNTRVFHPSAEPYPLQTTKTFKFLFVGGTIWRKGVDLLLEAYMSAFRREDDVSLVIKDLGQDTFYKGQAIGDRIDQIRSDPDAPEVLHVTETLAEKDMPGLFTACNCLVHPYRGEGFGLPVLEAMACGLPPIVTSGGATDDFCSPERAFLIPSRLMPFVTPHVQFAGGVGWVLEPDVEALKAILKHVYEHPEDLNEKRTRGLEYARTHCAWDKVAEQIMARVRKLVERPTRRMGRAQPTVRQ